MFCHYLNSMENAVKPIVFVDKREPVIRDRLDNFNCIVKDKMLLVGDFIVSDRICIERKISKDFVQSIVDQRLFTQLKKMKENYEKPVLIIEGNDLYGRLHPNAIRGALTSITIDMGIPILWSSNPEESAGLIYWLARKEQIDQKRSLEILEGRRGVSKSKKQEFIVAGLPNVSAVLAKRILKHFKTIKSVFNASEKELQEVDGIGKEKAKKIVELIESKYK